MYDTQIARLIGSKFDRVPEALLAPVRSSHTLEKEDVFELLYNPRRRHTLQLLAQHGRSYSMDELVERIAAKENGVPVGELERQQRRRVHVSLYQTHLPLLDEADAIEYDQQTAQIAPGPVLRELIPYLEVITTTVPWRAYYRWLFACSLVLGTVVFSGLLTSPSFLVLAIGVSALFALLALVHGTWTAGGLIDSGPVME